jgi:hypothetical protein
LWRFHNAFSKSATSPFGEEPRPNLGVVISRSVWQCTKGQLKGESDMSFKKASIVAMLAISMASTPVLAQAATSASSAAAVTASARSGAEMDDANAVRGGWFIPLLALIAIILGILAATSDGGDRPVSP